MLPALATARSLTDGDRAMGAGIEAATTGAGAGATLMPAWTMGTAWADAKALPKGDADDAAVNGGAGAAGAAGLAFWWLAALPTLPPSLSSTPAHRLFTLVGRTGLRGASFPSFPALPAAARGGAGAIAGGGAEGGGPMPSFRGLVALAQLILGGAGGKGGAGAAAVGAAAAAWGVGDAPLGELTARGEEPAWLWS